GATDSAATWRNHRVRWGRTPKSAFVSDAAALQWPDGMSAATVLIVEDDLSLQQVIQELVVQMGLRASVAGDVPRALEILGSTMHNLVLTDLNLPGQSGLDLLKA